MLYNHVALENMNNFSKIKAAYIAGIIDGEGHITVSKRVCKKTRRGVSYAARLTVVNTNPAMIWWLKNITGMGSVHYIESDGRRKGKWDWTCCAKDAKAILKNVIPFLICKVNQANLLMSFMECNKRQGRRGLSEKEWEQREAAYSKMRELNRTGVIRR